MGKRSFSQQPATEAEQLEQGLDNVVREFPIESLRQLNTVPTIAEAEGQVIGMITQDQRIESVDEATIKELTQPFVQRHVDKYMPEYSNFKITNSGFVLFNDGALLLALSIISDDNLTPRQVYVKPMIASHCILVPRQTPTYSCSKTSCPSNCRVHGKVDTETWESKHWCQCQSSGYAKNEGCDLDKS